MVKARSAETRKIISKVKQCGVKKYFKGTMKFGIECPNLAKEAMELD